MTSWNKLFLIACAIVLAMHRTHAMTSLARNDAYPVYTTADPHYFLTREYRAILKERVVYDVSEWLRISATLFRQRASVGTNFWNRKYVNLGSIDGNWNLPSLFYPEADGNTDIQTALVNALNLSNTPCLGTLENPDNYDSTHKFGNISPAILYRKFGARFQVQLALGWDFGITIEAGVADIRQTATLVDLTCSATGLACPVVDCATTCSSSSGESCTVDTACATEGSCTPSNCCIDVFSCDCKRLVMNKIVKKLCTVTDILDLNINDFHKNSAEDTRVQLFWRHPWEVNVVDCGGWAHFIFMPFFEATMSAPTGDKKCPKALFSLPFGSNGHWGYGFNTGFTIDFIETIELDFEAGMTKFNTRLYCDVPVPTSCFQGGFFYTRKADLLVSPGTNWNIGIGMSAYHFLDRLSFWGQYVMVDHSPDCIEIAATAGGVPVSNIVLRKFREETEWRVHLANIAFNYDISPNIALGFLWQAPIKQFNAYQSTTIMGSIIITW